MRTIYITDTHITADAPPHRSPCSWVDFIFDRIEEIIDKEKPVEVWHGGDVFHSPHTSVEVVLRTRDRMRACNTHWVLVPGNHDRVNGRVSPCILDLLLAGNKTVEILQDGQTQYGWATLSVSGACIDEQANTGCDAVILHQDIGPDGVRTHNGVSAVTLFNQYPQAKYILCGHIHRQFMLQQDNRYLINPGCFAARTRDEIEQGVDGGYVVLDTEAAPRLKRVGNLDDVLSIEKSETAGVAPIDLRAILNHHSDQTTLPIIAEDNLLEALMGYAGFDYDFDLVQAAVDFCREVD